MNPTHLEYLNLLLRWVHVLAGILWIGSSLFFVWLDNNLREPQQDARCVEGELRMVHGGGYWLVSKRRFEPGQVPSHLHWFKWEAYTTWISGLALLAVVYFMGRGILTDPTVSAINHPQAVALGIGTLVVGWLVYDLVWRSALARNPTVCAGLSFALLIALTYGLAQLLPGRAAFIHVGALLGTLMAGNVLIHIIPTQRRVIAAVAAGQPHDLVGSEQARQRSLANNTMTFPVVFLMLSSHYPSVVDHPLSWLLFSILAIAGVTVNHCLNRREHSRLWNKAWIPASLGAIAIAAGAIFVLLAQSGSPIAKGSGREGAAPERVSAGLALEIVTKRCVSCHATRPTDADFPAPPLGIKFDTAAQVQALATRIKLRAVALRTMPLGNKTGMTPDERILLGRWIDQGALIDR